MTWQDELKKEIADKTLLDFDSLDWQVLISFIKLQLKKQREICANEMQDEEPGVLYSEVEPALRRLILKAPEPGGGPDGLER